MHTALIIIFCLAVGFWIAGMTNSFPGFIFGSMMCFIIFNVFMGDDKDMVCVVSHTENRMVDEPAIIGIDANSQPIYTYYKQEEPVDICDKEEKNIH